MSRTDSKRRAALWLGALILLIAFALRAHRLAYDSIWWDEGFSIWMGRMPIGEMLIQTARDAHPPLSYAMLHGWIALVGQEEFALRLQSVLFGVLTAAAACQIGRVAGGRQAGLAGALFVAVMRLPVWWSQEVRMYAPATLFAALAMWAALKLFTDARKSWLWALLLALSLGAGLLTLYLFAGVVLALNLAFIYAFFTSPRRWKLAAAWIGAQIGALALFFPWVLYAINHLPSWERPPAPVDFLYVVKLYLSTIFLGIATDIEQYLALLILASILFAGAAALAFAGSPRRSRMVWVTLMIGALLPPVLVYLLSIPRGAFNYPVPSPRYFLLLSTPVYVLVGWGAVALTPHPSPSGRAGIAQKHVLKYATRALLLLPMLALATWSLSIYYPGLRLADDYPSMAAALEALRQPGDVVVLNNDTDWPIFDYHYRDPYMRHISQHVTRIDDKYAAGLFGNLRNDSQGIWLVQTRYAEVTDPHNNIGRWLAERSWDQRRYVFPTGQLWFFAMKQERVAWNVIDRAVRWPEAFQPAEVPVAEGVQLAGFTRPVPEVLAGDMMVVGLGWHVEEGVEGEWPVAVKLIGADGGEIASQPVTLTAGGVESDRFLPVQVFVPPGTSGGRAQIVFVAGESWVPLDTVLVRARREETLEQAVIPASAQEVNIRFGEAVTLVAVDLPDQDSFAPGENIPLVLYWRADGVLRERYKVFVHVRGETYDPSDDSNIWGQQDQEPRNAASPTTSWRPGEVIADDYLVAIQPDTPAGEYRIQIGLYLPLGGQRLPAFDTNGAPLGDALTITEIEVAP